MNAQARPIIFEDFTIAGDATVYSGCFGDPTIIPLMTRQGYEDQLVVPMKAPRTQWPTTPPQAKRNLIRTQTGRTFFIQVIDFTEVVVFTFILTDREL